MKSLISYGKWPTIILAGAAFLGITIMLGFGYRATREWQRSSDLLTERDTSGAADLLVKAVMRDMAGMQLRVLANGDWAASLGSLADTSTQVAIAFTQYPYPESFFTWRAADKQIVFFNRASRSPEWMPRTDEPRSFPVFLVTDPPHATELRQRINGYGADHYRYVVFDTQLADQPYQVVARLMYTDPMHEEPDAVIGFTVNLAWVRASYIADLFSQLVRLADRERSLAIAVLDEHQKVVWGSENGQSELTRTFPLLFLDPTIDKVALSPFPPARTWSIHVSQGHESPLTTVSEGADEALWVATAATVVLCVGLVLAIRSIRSEIALAKMRSDFVSSVTHELKMPLANIRIMADRLALQPAAAEKIHRYAALLRQESRRLGQLIDNLLAYARVTDVADVYSFEPVAVPELVHAALHNFEQAITEHRFAVDVDVPVEIPPVRADRAAMMLVLDNLLDNAIRYSADRRALRISARRREGGVAIEVSDRGAGIAAAELPAIQGKFVRGRHATSHGSGLGLTIVSRIIADHGGTFTLKSEHGVGTAALIDLPVAEDHDA